MRESFPADLRFQKFTLQDIREGRLDSFMTSSAIIPLSQLRLKSLLNNPRALDTDTVMVLVTKNEELIAYRSVMPDDLHDGVRKIHIAWLSGIWVKPEYRRMGIASKFYEIYHEAWSGMLFATEFTPANGKTLASTGYFEQPIPKNGVRIFYKSPLREIIAKRHPNLIGFGLLASSVDGMLNFAAAVRKLFSGRFGLPDACSFSFQALPSEEGQRMIQEFKSYSSANRRMPELRWIIENPWIGSDPEEVQSSKKYYFSVYARQFEAGFMEVRRQNSLLGVAMITFRDGKLRIPYLFAENDVIDTVARCILKYAYDKNVALIISYHELLNDKLLKADSRRLYARRTTRYYIVSKLFNKIYPSSSLVFADGDGDTVFV